MYNAYFGFARRPFAPAPQVDQYFPATTIEDARQTLARCIERAEGAAMVVGPSGTGKTLLCRVLAAQLGKTFKVILLYSGRLSTRRNLFQALLYELGQPYRGMDEGEARLALVDHLTTSEDCARGIVLLVDEAHCLPLRLLEEIRMLTNVARDGRPLVRLAMAGACVLEERFAHPRLDSFSQRLVARSYLESLNRTETQDYIQAQIESVAGAAQSIFPPDTCRSVHQATDGVPRLVNQVCDHALLLGYAAGRRQLLVADVEEAWADLQQLPTPFNEERQDESSGGVIEFGGLDDAPAEEQRPDRGDASLPPLRITPDAEAADHGLGEPDRELDHIQRMLGAVQDDFQPVGSIGPELELVFEDPFQEEFEKEEVVVDHHESKGGRPRDLSAETDALQHDLPCQSAEPGDHLPAAAESDGHEQPLLAEGPQDPAASRYEAELETLPLHPEQPAEEASDDEDMLLVDDEDVLLVDDDRDDDAATCSIVAVRRREYGRLFTKLRHG